MTVPARGPGVRIEPMTAAHAGAVLAIYQAGIEEGNATFETRAPAWPEFTAARLPGHRFVAPASETWSQLAAGDGFTCGLTTVGHAYCWGDDLHGQLGTVRTQLGDGRDRIAVAARVLHGLGLGLHRPTVPRPAQDESTSARSRTAIASTEALRRRAREFNAMSGSSLGGPGEPR